MKAWNHSQCAKIHPENLLELVKEVHKNVKQMGNTLAILGKLVVLLDQVMDVVLVTCLYVVAMVTIVAHMDHVKKGVPKLI